MIAFGFVLAFDTVYPEQSAACSLCSASGTNCHCTRMGWISSGNHRALWMWACPSWPVELLSKGSCSSYSLTKYMQCMTFLSLVSKSNKHYVPNALGLFTLQLYYCCGEEFTLTMTKVNHRESWGTGQSTDKLLTLKTEQRWDLSWRPYMKLIFCYGLV